MTQPDEYFTLITPVHRTMEAATVACILRAQQAKVPFVWVPRIGDTVSRARSIEATRVLDHKHASPYAIFLDSDIVFTPEDLQRLWESLHEHDLIGGCYVTRNGQQMAHYGDTVLDGSIQEVEYLSAGFTGFTRGLLEKIVRACELPLCHPLDPQVRCYPFFAEGATYHEQSQQWIWRSEDWHFVDLARQVGIVPRVDTRIRLGHIGSRTYTVQDLPT